MSKDTKVRLEADGRLVISPLLGKVFAVPKGLNSKKALKRARALDTLVLVLGFWVCLIPVSAVLAIIGTAVVFAKATPQGTIVEQVFSFVMSVVLITLAASMIPGLFTVGMIEFVETNLPPELGTYPKDGELYQFVNLSPVQIDALIAAKESFTEFAYRERLRNAFSKIDKEDANPMPSAGTYISLSNFLNRH